MQPNVWLFESDVYGFHLENQHPSVRNRQTEFSTLSVLGRVQTDAVHLQPPSDFQQLVVRHCRSLSAVEEGDQSIH